MSDFNEPVHGKDSPYEKIIVNPIEKDRKAKEEFSSFKRPSRPQILSTLVSCFKKITYAFTFKGKPPSVFLKEQSVIDHLIAFRNLLDKLSQQDLSHEPLFLEALSTTWHALIDSIESKKGEFYSKTAFFIGQVENYPLGADHTLGYYFQEYAGKEWLPFPLMELLQDLHRQFQQTPQHSVLHNWLFLLDEIVELHFA